MAKRFIDTAILKHHFTRGLDTPYKLLWIHILTDCSHAGIWQVDWQIAGIVVGAKIDPAKAKKVFNTKIIELKNGSQWFLPDFIEFQYGRLSEKNKAHNGIISLLKRENLLNDDLSLKFYEGAFKPPSSPLQGDKEKEMEMDKDMEKEEELEKGVQGEKPKAHPDFQKCIEIYDKFILEQTSTHAQIDGGEGKAMNSIISALSKTEKVEDGSKSIPEVWEYILKHRDSWDAFHQTQLKIKQINSNLVNILTVLKNGNPRKQSTKNAGAAEIHAVAQAARNGNIVDFVGRYGSKSSSGVGKPGKPDNS